MKPFPVHIGVDEIATETQKCDGWTYFCLPEVHVADFVAEAQAIIDASSLHAFHGKKFKVGHSDEYRAFLKLIRKYQEKSLQALSVNTLLADSMKVDLDAFGLRILTKIIEKVGLPPGPAVTLLSPYVAPLLSLARISNKLGSNLVMQVEMDACEQLKDLDQTVYKVRGKPISGHVLLKGMYNGFAKMKFPKAPLLPNNGICVMKDSKSFLIQAADVLGNFSMAYVFVKLGKKSKSKEAKAALIEEVWGDTIEAFDFSSKVSLVGEDLVLCDGQAGLTFRISFS
jgi:hypothetical protein